MHSLRMKLEIETSDCHVTVLVEMRKKTRCGG